MHVHRRPPTRAELHTTLNDRIAARIATGVGSMTFFWLLAVAMAAWMAGLGADVFGDPYPWALMLLVVGGIFQALAMIAILVNQNQQGVTQDAQVQHLHDLSVQTHALAEQVLAHLAEPDGIKAVLDRLDDLGPRDSRGRGPDHPKRPPRAPRN